MGVIGCLLKWLVGSLVCLMLVVIMAGYVLVIGLMVMAG